MKFNFTLKYLNYSCIIIGAFIAMYAKYDAKQNVYILIIGIVLLMFGIYRVSRNIPSKNDEDFNKNRE